MHKGQLIHESVFNLMDDATADYIPKAIVFDGSNWRRDDLEEQLVERDSTLR